MVRLFRVADAYVSVGVDYIFVSQNAVGDHKLVEQTF
jgi:hypothetical protein